VKVLGASPGRRTHLALRGVADPGPLFGQRLKRLLDASLDLVWQTSAKPWYAPPPQG